PSSTAIHTLSLHDALPISCSRLKRPVVMLSRCSVTSATKYAYSSRRIDGDGVVEAVSGADGATAARAQRAATSRGSSSPVSAMRSEEHTSELQSLTNLVCR